MPPYLPSDFERSLLLVAEGVPRLLALQDRDELSPSRGSFHAAFWRDKTSNVLDARMQSAAAALLLLAESRVLAPYAPEEPLRSAMKRAAAAGLSCWAGAQYPEGCFDGWYRGERSLGATGSTSLHVGLALRRLDDDVLTPGLGGAVRGALKLAASWLSQREEVDRPHQLATAVAALAVIGRVLESEEFVFAARRKLEALLAVQAEEGWFFELGGHADVGSTFRLIESLAIYAHESDDWSFFGQLERAFEFAATYLHPGASTGAEYGVSHDDYVSRVAIVLLAGKLPLAARLLNELCELGPDEVATPTQLLDDHLLCRHAPLPLLAAVYHRELGPSIEENRQAMDDGRDDVVEVLPAPAKASRAIRVTHHARARMLAVEAAGRRLIVAPGAGGALRFFSCRAGDAVPREVLLEDLGYRFLPPDGRAQTTLHPSAEPQYSVHDNGDCVVISIQLEFAALRYFFPTFWSRLLLQMASATRRTSQWTRRYINWFRRRAKSALVQAAPPSIVAGRKYLRLDRTVTLDVAGRLEIDDVFKNITADRLVLAEGRLRGRTGTAPPEYEAAAQEAIAVARKLRPGVPLTITRSIDVDRADDAELSG